MLTLYNNKALSFEVDQLLVVLNRLMWKLYHIQFDFQYMQIKENLLSACI